MASASPRKQYTLSIDDFRGGLNIRDMEYNLAPNESPDMKNMLWRNGLLASRKGQKFLSSVAYLGRGCTLFSSLWHGHLFAHIGSRIYAFDVDTGDYTQLCTGVPSTRGTFFLFGDNLYYKTTSAYKKITAALVSDEWTFTASNVTAYTPVILINADPATGAGDIYQPENRFSEYKTVWYNAVSGATQYKLPVIALFVSKVVVDGVELTSGWSYSMLTGVVYFTSPPPVTNPPTNNTVRITYSLGNPSAYNALDSCRYAEVYGGAGALVVVMAGSSQQPNAYFWSGNSNVAMDPGYFPMEHYQLAGETSDPITGFGKQQSNLVIFQEHQVGKAQLGIVSANIEGGSAETGVSRLSIDMPYVPINTKIGCKYPWTIQLVQNNLVWVGAQGVYMLMDTTDANENYIKCLSDKINGTSPGSSSGTLKKAFLYNLSRSSTDEVCGFDDEHRYYVTANGVTYAWDYDISTIKDPAWFLLTSTNFFAAAYSNNDLYFLNSSGQVICLQSAFEDFGRAFERYYRLGSQFFGSLEERKNVDSVIISLGADYDSDSELKYFTDHAEWLDPTNLQVIPANTYEADREPGTRPKSSRLPAVFRRRPMARNVLFFSFQIRNANLNEDLALNSAQIIFSKNGRLR